ncbi:hypothetical protein BJX68DRAFT_268890 [Aspergillus pseudodeflectus]|uniref:Tyrosinase copper-binding domain-containing protein n=1 Tax=Aspergillus pseudodeflectus TaxID=176178 RepID=A0ABR4K145_9EURO
MCAHRYYPIQGIKDGLSPDGQVPIRREINEWIESKDQADRDQVVLFVLALDYFQQMDPKDRDSYFQIAGIHGMPYKSWDEPEATVDEVHGKGYCVHANCLFPLWHRPYLLLYEQRIYEIIVGEIIPKMQASKTKKDELRKAASTWRLPYWDWAKNATIPKLLDRETLNMKVLGKSVAKDNPLFKFRMPQQQKMADFGVGSLKWWEFPEPLRYGECLATSRCPTDKERTDSKSWANGVVNTKTANEFLNKQPSITGFEYGEATELVYRLLTYPMNFVSFATTARDASEDSSSKTKVTNDMNLEFIHNNIHYWVGGDGGHMSQIPVATFDPVFCNLDRLYAIWQTLHPEEWFKADTTRIFNQETIGMGKIITNKTAFRPFHKDEAGTLWTPNDARDWFKLGYTYPELKRWKYATDQDQTLALHEYINNNYGVTRRQALGIAKSDAPIDGIIATADGVKTKDYAVSIRYAKFAMGGNPFNLKVYLLPKGETQKTFADAHFVTNVYNFSQPATQNGETVCSNCADLEAQNVQVTAYIPLTTFLIKKIQQQQLQSLEPVHVEDLLNGRLYWEVDMMGTQIPEERWKDKLNLDVQVSVTEMSYAEDPKAPADFQEPEIIPTLGTEADRAPEPGSAADINQSVNDTVKDNGLGDFFPLGNTYPEEVAKKAAELKNDPNNPLKSPEQLKDLATLALYQPVIYCDDSGSMSDTGPWRNTEQRWAKQRELVTRMTSITNRAVPNNQRKGVHLRMINQSISNADNLDSDAVARIISNMYPHPYHSTPIGTNLKQKVLDPLVYSVIKAGRKLERPYLILILTDGCPWMEPEDAFRNAIVDCARFLDRNGYRKDAVRFCLSTIGTHEDAEWFLDSFDTDRQALEVLHRTAAHIDQRYDQLRQNEKELESWVIVINAYESRAAAENGLSISRPVRNWWLFND